MKKIRVTLTDDRGDLTITGNPSMVLLALDLVKEFYEK